MIKRSAVEFYLDHPKKYSFSEAIAESTSLIPIKHDLARLEMLIDSIISKSYLVVYINSKEFPMLALATNANWLEMAVKPYEEVLGLKADIYWGFGSNNDIFYAEITFKKD